MKLGHIEIPSEDAKQTAEFYCQCLGFTVEAVQGDDVFWLARDAISFLVRPKNSAGDVHNVVFYSSAVDEDVQGVRQAGLEVRFGSDNCHHFKDPNGYPLQIVDPEADHSG